MRLWVLLICCLFVFSNFINAQIKLDLQKLYQEGCYHEVVLRADLTKNFQNWDNETLLILANSYLKLGEAQVSWKVIKILSERSLDKDSSLQIALSLLKANYLHYTNKTDLAMEHLQDVAREIHSTTKTSNDLLFDYYSISANIKRNSSSFIRSKHVYLLDIPNDLRQIDVFHYLDSAFRIANEYQKPELYRILATAILDHFVVERKETNHEFFIFIQKYLSKAVDESRKMSCPNLLLTRVKIIESLSLMNLGLLNDAKFEAEQAVKLSSHNNKHFNFWNYSSRHLLGWINFESYTESNSYRDLVSALEIYEAVAPLWKSYIEENNQNSTGYIDEYWLTPFQKIPVILYEMNRFGYDKELISKALYYNDFSFSSAYWMGKSSKIKFDLEEIQRNMSKNEALIVYVKSRNPNFFGYVILTKNDIQFNELKRTVSTDRLNQYDEDFKAFDVENYKKSAHYLYKTLFGEVDEYCAKNAINSLTIIPTSRLSWISFESLLRSTRGNSWKHLDYIGNDLRINYEHNVTQFYLNQNDKRRNRYRGINVLHSNSQSFKNYLYSDDLNQYIDNNYQNIDIQSRIKDFHNRESSIFLVQGHGVQVKNDQGFREMQIEISDSTSFTKDDVLSFVDGPSLFIISSCNSERTEKFNLEGTVSTFSKITRFNGIESVISTIWPIDDESNAKIMKSFFENLSTGLTKSEALYQAKLRYRMNVSQEEAHHPIYWAGYKFYGKDNKLIIPTKSEKHFWLYTFILLLSVDIGFLLYFFRSSLRLFALS